MSGRTHTDIQLYKKIKACLQYRLHIPNTHHSTLRLRLRTTAVTHNKTFLNLCILPRSPNYTSFQPCYCKLPNRDDTSQNVQQLSRQPKSPYHCHCQQSASTLSTWWNSLPLTTQSRQSAFWWFRHDQVKRFPSIDVPRTNLLHLVCPYPIQ